MSAATNGAAKTLIIMRGLPGSGKSFLAKYLYDGIVGLGNSCIIHSTDNFHLEHKDGKSVYVFKPEKLRYFHEQNLKHAITSMEMGIDCAIIDNTNTTWKEMEAYVRAGIANGYSVVIEESNSAWKYDVEECTKRNTHGVPKEAIQRMRDRWETTESLLAKRNLLLKEEANKQNQSKIR